MMVTWGLLKYAVYYYSTVFFYIYLLLLIIFKFILLLIHYNYRLINEFLTSDRKVYCMMSGADLSVSSYSIKGVNYWFCQMLSFYCQKIILRYGVIVGEGLLHYLFICWRCRIEALILCCHYSIVQRTSTVDISARAICHL